MHSILAKLLELHSFGGNFSAGIKMCANFFPFAIDQRSASTSECFRMFYVLWTFSFYFPHRTKKNVCVKLPPLLLLLSKCIFATEKKGTRRFFSALHLCLLRFVVVVVGGGHQKHNNREPSIEMHIHLKPFISVFQSSCEFVVFSAFFLLFVVTFACGVARPFSTLRKCICLRLNAGKTVNA